MTLWMGLVVVSSVVLVVVWWRRLWTGRLLSVLRRRGLLTLLLFVLASQILFSVDFRKVALTTSGYYYF